MTIWPVIILTAAVAVAATSVGAQTAPGTPTKQAKKPAPPVATATQRSPSADAAKPLDPTVGLGGLQFQRQEFDTGRDSGTRYQTDLTPRKDLCTQGERRPGDVPVAPVDATRPAGATFGGGVGIRL